MTAEVDQPEEAWERIRTAQIEPPHSDSSLFLEENKELIRGIMGIALLAISSLIAGGLLLHFEVNTIAAYSLISVGAGLGLGDLISGVMLYLDREGVLTEDGFTE